jgi:competence protein ComEC
VLLTSYCGGLLLSLAARPPLWLLASCAVALTALILALSRPSKPPGWWCTVRLPAAFSLLLLVAGMAVGGSRMEALEDSVLAGYVGQTVALVGVVTDLPGIAEDVVTLAVDVHGVEGVPLAEPARLRLSLGEGQGFQLDPCGPVREGALVSLQSVRVRPLPAARPERFDYGRYLRRRGEHVLLEAPFTSLRITGRRGGLQGMVDGLRLSSRAHLRAGLLPPVRDVLQGMVLGDDEGVEDEVIDDFRRSGLLHIMAVSGENVVLLCSMWTFVFALLAIPRLVRTALLLPVVATYVLLTGADPSIVRAGVAGIVGLLAVMASRPADGWLLWLAPGAWLLSVNPNNFFDVSFQLSFGAVLGLLILARPLTRAFAFLPGPLPEQIGVTTAASLSTAPISMLAFGSASLVSVPANVAGGFVLGPIMFLGMASMLAGFAAPWLSVPLNLLAGLFIGFLLTVARLFGRLPWAVYEWQGVSLGLVLSVTVLLASVSVWQLARRAGESPAGYVTSPRRRTSLIVVSGATAAVLILLVPGGAAAPAQSTLTFLDVGEGAATLVQIPRGPTILVDAGPAPLGRQLREHGVRRIDLLVLSHGHADHVAGLQDVIGRFEITTALMPAPTEPSSALDRLGADLQAAGAEVRRCGSPVSLGGAGWGLRVLPTRALPGTGGNQGENDTALVVLAELGRGRVLVPGDAEGEVLARLDLPPCDVVGVPHHGSAGGFSPLLLARLAPRVAVIPVGPNRYGHPTQEMLDVLADGGVPCLRTDHHGDIAVTALDEGLGLRVGRAGLPPPSSPVDSGPRDAAEGVAVSLRQLRSRGARRARRRARAGARRAPRP